MKRLAELVQDEIGNVHHVVDGPQADGLQPIPQPIRRRPHFYAADHHADVAWATFGILNLDGYLFGSLASSLNRCDFGQFERLLCQRSHVAGDADVAGGVRAIGGDGEVQHGVALQLAHGLHILRERLSDLGRVIQHEDAIVFVPEAQFIFCADHPLRDLSAQFRLLDLDRHALARIFARG